MKEDLARTLDHLVGEGFAEVEVYARRGRSRRLEIGLAQRGASFHQEQGWAVRAGGDRSSLFASGTGPPPTVGPWPEADGWALRLPDPASTDDAWSEPADLDAPLIGETEGLRWLSRLEQGLHQELPTAKLVRAVLEDGSSESRINSTRGIATAYRRRLAALRLEAVLEAEGRLAAATLYVAEREARKLDGAALGRRLADRLTVGATGRPVERDRGELLLAPEVATALLHGLLPLLVGPRAGARLAGMRDGRGRIASDALTVVDDGRWPGGLCAAAVDGEGLPTRRIPLIAQGHFGQPLLAWHQQQDGEGQASGCSRRASWRDLPIPGPTHLAILPDPAVAVSSLLADIARGYYFIDASGPARLSPDGSRFALPAAGFLLQSGKATAPVRGAVITGTISALLRGVQAVARDLTFLPLDGMIGSPTLLLSGLEVHADDGRGP